MEKYQILSNKNILIFECECESFKECVERAVKEGISLMNADLSNKDLSHINLTDADLTSANLISTNLTGVKLTRAILTSANLTGVNLAWAALYSTNLYYVNLTGANLTNAFLTNANLVGVNLTGANLTRVDLTRVNLTSAQLISANLTDAILTDAILIGVNLTDIVGLDNELMTSILVSEFDELHTKFETLQQELNNKSYHLAKLLLNTIDERISLCGDEKDNIHSFDIIFDWFDEYTNNIEQHHIKTIYKDSDDMLYIEDENEANYELSELDIDVQIKVIVRLIAFSKKESKVE